MTLALSEEPVYVKDLRGSYLFGGMFFHHFGHFITETIGRLWANNSLFDGILMTPKHANLTHFKRGQRELLQMLGADTLPILISEPTLVERLTVPGQAFGLGSISAATPEFKKFIKEALRKTPASGPEKIYISRTQYAAQGGILAEAALEKNLVLSGYEPVYPEKLSWKDQIALYRGAKKIISVDSSALHMVAMAAEPDTDVAVIVRRNNFEWDCMRRQLVSFIEKPPIIVNELIAEYVVSGKKSNHHSWGVIDFPAVRKRLIENQLITDLAEWILPSDDFMRSEVREAQRRDKRLLVRSPVGLRIR